MGYIATTYDPFVVATTNTTLDKVQALADLALKDIFPGESYSNFEVQIWVVMRKMLDDDIDSRNHYSKVGHAKPVLQKLQGL